MNKKPACQFCLFLRILLIGCLGALVGVYLSMETGTDTNAYTWPAAIGALAALLLGRRWLK